MKTLGNFAKYIRSKNAGPFWLTLDVFFNSSADYRLAIEKAFITPEVINELYGTPVDKVQIFPCENLNVIKISVPRPVIQGNIHDRDIHGGQQFVLLEDLPLNSPMSG